MRKLWKAKSIKIWLITTIVITFLFIAINVVALKIPFIYGTINSVLGGERQVLVEGNPEEHIIYQKDYQTKDEVLLAANQLNERIVEEGIVLLKNEESALPLEANSKITVLGKNSTNIVLGGSGSSAGSGTSSTTTNLYTSIKNAGFQYNPVAKDFFESKDSGSGRAAIPGMGSILTGYPIGEASKSSYQDNLKLKNSFAEYSDAAIVVITRIGGEGYDLPRTMFWDGSKYTNWSSDKLIPGARSTNDHYLQLDQNETDLLAEAAKHFSKIIVLINSSTPLELGFLDDPLHYAYQEQIKAALWIGNPGESGLNAIGKILKGEINPSGRTVDTYARDFKKDPTWNNFGNNLIGGGNKYSLNGSDRNAFFVEYQEGIYVGYRYYQTRAYLEGEQWYRENVVYPFGYGLSYTTFKQEIVSKSHADEEELKADDIIKVRVEVTNTGDVAGKEVVQLYYTPPYFDGEIEKPHLLLAAFGKTAIINPGESEIIELEFNAREMAAYDFNDANKNGFIGYELEGGVYQIKLMKNAYQVLDSFSLDVASEGIKYKYDNETGKEIKNLFDDVSEHIESYLSRSDFEGTWPTVVTDREVSAEFISSLTYQLKDLESDPWYSSTTPQQAKKESSYNKTKIKLYHLINKDFDDPLWEELLDQLTISQMVELISKGNYKTINIDNIAKPLTIDADGPMGFAIFMGDPAVYKTAYYASEAVIGATWNTNLAKEMGRMVGNEGLIGNERGDGRPYSGWYAPAVNIHRSQFGGRNFEYYSEDPLLSGKMGANVILGAKSKGVYTYLKHFALNDQETNRDTTGLITWANEQAMREIYFLPFEIAVKEGKTTAMMSAFNRIGTVWAGGSYPLLTQLLREEWGFNGMVITDFNLTPYMNVDQMVRAGGDLNLSPSKNVSDTSSTTGKTAIRKAAKNILYSVANSNAMNGLGEGIRYKYKMPKWVSLLIIVDIGVVLSVSGSGAYLIVKQNKKIKEEERE
ncbi:MAG: glycoside hydrolase family 3 C-terminal domain-containing protein [Acholeplasmataceae bacterium]|nr:glycoside hydrolase family 3 C-terminal domain-containing protein [Acholeplasmataceae bacterium]MCK9427993.1 glycoside hydrolase family 3 C-terminal domain-containing protein [Acholeplasmataceae bacterium]